MAYIDKMREDIYAEYTTHKWISETGLGRLDPFPGDSQIGPDGRETVMNENGILFETYFLITAAISRINIMPHAVYLKDVVDSLRTKTHPGLFNRQPHGDAPVHRHEAQDNYAAIAGLGTWIGYNYASDILAWGERHGYNYNNVNPEVWDIKQQRQGGEIAYYKAMAGYVPTIWEWIWLMGGLLAGAFSKNGASDSMLSWMRMYFLNQVDLPTTWQKLSMEIITPLWKQIKILRLGTLESIFRQYFRKDSPIVKLASLLGKDFGF